MRRERRRPVDAARVLRPQIARAIVQLDDDVHWQLTQPLDQRDAERLSDEAGDQVGA